MLEGRQIFFHEVKFLVLGGEFHSADFFDIDLDDSVVFGESGEYLCPDLAVGELEELRLKIYKIQVLEIELFDGGFRRSCFLRLQFNLYLIYLIR